MIDVWRTLKRRFLIFLTVFGPATIAAMADNDASGVATYSIAGATLGYPILFVLFIITFALGLTQEMGIRLALVTRKGLGDLIREHFGVRASVLVFFCLFIANMGTIVVDLAAVKTTSTILHLPATPAIMVLVIVSFFFVTKGNYKINQNIMLLSCLFYLAYIFSAFKANPNWGAAVTNVFVPVNMKFNAQYVRNFIVIGLGVLGTTITPWGQFFISSFAFDKNIETQRIKYSQFETYWGAFLTNFFSFFMIVATAATLFAHRIPLISGEQAALAIKPFAGELAGSLFAVGILNAGFMGIVTVSLSTAYAFAEFFGISGSLNTSFDRGRAFYLIFLVQLILASVIVMMPSVSLFQLAIATQALNAIMLPIVFYYLIKLTNNKEIMGTYINTPLQKNFAVITTIAICVASLLAITLTVIR